MPKDYSPFMPGAPIPVEFFIGRTREIEFLSSKIRMCGTGQVRAAFLTGERGIGKSSLAKFVRHLVETNDEFIGFHANFGGVKTLTQMAKKIFNELARKSKENNWLERLKDFFGDHVRQVGAFGVNIEFNVGKKDLEYAVNNFGTIMYQFYSKIKDDREGMLLIFDDINGLAASSDFAHWIKSLVDGIAVSEMKLPLFLLFVGLEERRQSLIKHQPSVARIFDITNIKSWNSEETEEFFRNSFNRVGIHCEPNALKLLVNLSGGIPVIAQELGDSVYNIDSDDKISEKDVTRGLIIAANVLGGKYIGPQVSQIAENELYVRILRKINKLLFLNATDILTPPLQFQRSEVWDILKEDEKKKFDYLLNKLSKIGIIEKAPDFTRGSYRFRSYLHNIYLLMETELEKFDNHIEKQR